MKVPTKICRYILVLIVVGAVSAGFPVEAEKPQPPKVVIISLDGARPQLVERYLRAGVHGVFHQRHFLSRRPPPCGTPLSWHGSTRSVRSDTVERSVMISVPSGVPGTRPFPPG